ncbi:MAG: hypothetical protein JWQ02_2219 [Capsulimonas sp.]|jgi:hypothetical protein|nr:hypothetical protein [Capsulimonas sp.]
MAKSWSNRKVTNYVSPVVRARNRPSSSSIFLVALVVLFIFFFGLMLTITAQVTMHPKTQYKNTNPQPGDSQ